ncbi:MAG TPA: pitrilysin family protein [Candidatus Elarobacter sp.]|jgi:zinc protease|nr:pitrilysin family protein [Candidatus Elarobacter sp.]
MLLRRFIAAIAAVMLLCSPVQSRADGTSAATPAPQARTLANGLKVVVIEDHAAPVAQIHMWYRFGALDETPGKTGLAHALEHMMFRGTHDLSSAGLDDMTARLGAEVNAQTENEDTHFYFVVPADRVDTIVHLEADRMRGLKLAPADWNLERGAVLEEYAEKHSNPVTAFIYDVNQRVYPNSRLGSTSLGEKADIEHATVADLRKYYDEWYHPNNATLVVTGDVHADEVFAEAQRWFGPIPSAKLPQRRQYALHPATNVSYTMPSSYPYTMVDEAYAAPGDAKPYEHDQVRNDVALGAMFNPRGPFRALVERGLVLAYNPTPLEDRRASVVHVLLIVAPGHTPAEVRTAYEKTMADVLKRGLDPDLFDASKRSQLASMTYARDSIVGLGDAVGANMVFPGDTDPSQFDALYGAITRDEATAVARRVYAKANVVAVLRPGVSIPGSAQAPSNVTSSVSDNFGERTSNGPLVQPEWMKTALAKPLALRSGVDPVETTLPNGLRLLVQRVPTNPTVFVDGLVQTSPQFDPRGKEGLGEVTSALMDWGSAKYDYDAQRKVADDRAAEVSFGLGFFAHGRSADFPALLDLLADDVRRPLLPADRFDLVRSQLAGFQSKRALQAGFEAQRLFNAALYPAGDPALRVPTERSIGAVTLDDVKAFHAQYVRPDLTTLVVVGDVDPAAVTAQVQRAFGDWTASGPKPDPHLPAIPLPEPQTRIVTTASQDVTVQLGAPALPRGSPDFDALTLANTVYGGGSLESRLFREVREQRGLVYGASSQLDANRDRGTFTVEFSAVPSKIDAAETLVRAELRRMQTEDVTGDELVRAKTRVVATQLDAEQATSAIAGDLLRIGLNELPTTYYATLAERYASITAADVRRAAQAYFHPDNLVEVRIGPPA